MNSRAHQSQQEWNAGYRHGLNGGERPARDKGAAYYGGWLAGKADREESK